MKLGISTSCLYPMATEEAALWLADRHTPYLEVFLNSFQEAEPAFVRDLRKKLAERGTRALSVHPFSSVLEPLFLFSDYGRRYQEGLELYRHFFEAAAMLGAEVLVLHGDSLGSRFPEEEVFSRFGELALLGRQFGIILAQENTVRSRSRDPGFLVRMKGALGELAAFTLDVKQARRAGYAPGDFLDPLGNAVRHIHLSDADGERDCLPVGQGSEDIGGLMARLQEMGYEGGVMLELYRENFGAPQELIESLRRTEQLVGEKKG